jgi:excisionase family DNA binding protein
MLNDYGDILTLDELCEVLKISENVAYRLIREKTIPAFKVGRIYKIPQKAVEAYILTAAHMQ